ncbi:acyl-CoA dehydrogenase family protein [Acetobacter ascendens]|uniref:acyl-CoA dehydrogenase family protein n=1 Tax=Acetobacter ascendens TaxID=481146 RepID=UPI000875F101|nr:acyl-CoA dehydrogenase family protein [Acetobacter ascendens]AOW49058.1 acyl-CoA dehydrogenase [Acetobacter ascendens]
MLIQTPECKADLAKGPAFDALIEDISSRALEFRENRRITKDIIEKFQEIGVYRALVARQFGGMEVSPMSFLELIERIGWADASAGWVASFGVSATYLVALPLETLKKLYANGPDIVFAGAIFPAQPVQVKNDHFVVKGRWPFASGCTGASFIGVGIAVADEECGLPRTAVLPATDVTIDETWNTIGLSGTGSHDVVVSDVEVAPEWTFIRGGAPSLDLPLYRYPSLCFAAQVLSVVGLGCAQRAIDEVVKMATGRKSITGAPTMADRAQVQAAVGEVSAQLSAARAAFYGVTAEAWDVLSDGGTVTEDLANRIRLAATHAAQTCAEVARTCFALGGIAAVHKDHILARCLQDCVVVAQHAFMGRGNYEAAGRVMLGRGGRPGYP